jgi:hypothetical protein
VEEIGPFEGALRIPVSLPKVLDVSMSWLADIRFAVSAAHTLQGSKVLAYLFFVRVCHFSPVMQSMSVAGEADWTCNPEQFSHSPDLLIFTVSVVCV